MSQSWFNHITIHAKDVDESREFYEALFGVEVLPMPNMGAPGYWLKLGDLQLHLLGPIRPADGKPLTETIPKYHHFALGVKDFEKLYRQARERNIPEDDSMWGYPLNVLPNGQVQYYVRDPTGNLIEINWGDITSLPEDIVDRAEYQTLWLDQTPEQLKAALFLEKRENAEAGASKS